MQPDSSTQAKLIWLEANAYGKETLFDKAIALNAQLLQALEAVDNSFGQRLSTTLTDDENDALRQVTSTIAAARGEAR